MRKLLIGLRTSIKAIALFAISSIIILTIVMCVYKPIYSVTFKGEMIGYSKDKAALQAKINDYADHGNEEHIAFVQIEDLPEYRLCFLKRGIETNDDEIYEKVISEGVNYYNYFAISLDNEEKYYLASFEDAENVVNQLKEKDSNNIDSISINEKFVTDKHEITDNETIVSELYEEKVVQKTVTPKSSGGVRTAKVGSGYKSAGITFKKPVSATITSRFGSRWGKSHKGTDFGAPPGTSIYAAAAGPVTYAGWNSGG